MSSSLSQTSKYQATSVVNGLLSNLLPGVPKSELIMAKQIKSNLNNWQNTRPLKKHQQEGTLTDHERKYLNKLIKRNSQNLRSWDLEEEVRDELEDIQQSILKDTVSTANTDRSKRRRFKRKQFKEDIKESDFVKDHRYPGLTPGLAPVGLSDEGRL
ncbi:BPK_HP2_G0024520.mRNA.1.CDS.1 [Saccharomyces cerevisiae]|nr:BPK_HP2_G0024520.mRNA.1.CDS.1 [Saccharomyces cerevisiae]CAI6452271.1 BPK_HP2_G0024520.mRNA.1.CDS.1 [Saccharomyces cerevisiae]